MKFKTAILIVGLSILAFLLLLSPGGSTLPECAAEDDPRDCFWDAEKRGNGKGVSFIQFNGETYYKKGK